MRVKNARAVNTIGAIKNSYSSRISRKELACNLTKTENRQQSASLCSKPSKPLQTCISTGCVYPYLLLTLLLDLLRRVRSIRLLLLRRGGISLPQIALPVCRAGGDGFIADRHGWRVKSEKETSERSGCVGGRNCPNESGGCRAGRGCWDCLVGRKLDWKLNS